MTSASPNDSSGTHPFSPGPFDCPDCHAVGEEPCAPGCIDAAIDNAFDECFGEDWEYTP